MAAGEPLRILVVSEDPLLRLDVRHVLEKAGFLVTDQDGFGPDIVDRARTIGAAITVLDTSHRGTREALDVAERLWKEHLAPTLLLATDTDSKSLDLSLDTGVVGLVVKPFDDSQLLSCVVVGLRVRVTSPTLGSQNKLTFNQLVHNPRPSVGALSAREREVFLLLLNNRRVSHISRDLYISPYTVRNHLKAIFRKFGVTSQSELLDRFRKDGGAPSRAETLG